MKKTELDTTNLIYGAKVLEPACEYSALAGEKDSTKMRVACSPLCPEYGKCNHVFCPSACIGKPGETLRYSEFSGYSAVSPPNCITFDLGARKSIGAIHFLLWDNRGNGKTEICSQACHYRILICDDSGKDLELKYDAASGECMPSDGKSGVRWKVIYDTLRNSYNGWQLFRLSKNLTTRYIRIHFLASSKGVSCKLVRFEAYARFPSNYEHNFIPTFIKEIDIPQPRKRRWPIIGSIVDSNRHYVITSFTRELVSQLDQFIKRNPDKTELLSQVSLLRGDIVSVTGDLEPYEKRINDHIFTKASRLFTIGNIVSACALVLSFSLFLYDLLSR